MAYYQSLEVRQAMSHAFFLVHDTFGWDSRSLQGMKETKLFELLQSIPESSQEETIQGIRMEMIDISVKDDLLALDPDGMTFHECILKNGTFVFTTDRDHRLQTLFKVLRPIRKDIN